MILIFKSIYQMQLKAYNAHTLFWNHALFRFWARFARVRIIRFEWTIHRWIYVLHLLPIFTFQFYTTIPIIVTLCTVYTSRNLFQFLLNQTEIRLYLLFLDWFGTKRTSVWFQIHTLIIYFVQNVPFIYYLTWYIASILHQKVLYIVRERWILWSTNRL